MELKQEIEDKLLQIKNSLDKQIKIEIVGNNSTKLKFIYRNKRINLEVKNNNTVLLYEINPEQNIFIVDTVSINDLVYIKYRVESHLDIIKS